MNCINCLAAGHWCAVHKDETLCVYCLDGEPCPKSRSASVKPAKDEKATLTCGAPGCTVALRSDNKKGRCKAHAYVKKSDGAAKKKTAAKEPIKRDAEALKAKYIELGSSPNVTFPPPVATLTLEVTERHLDEYLMRLPLDRKLSIVQQEISNS
jgi:hypothetical protein